MNCNRTAINVIWYHPKIDDLRHREKMLFSLAWLQNIVARFFGNSPFAAISDICYLWTKLNLIMVYNSRHWRCIASNCDGSFRYVAKFELSAHDAPIFCFD